MDWNITLLRARCNRIVDRYELLRDMRAWYRRWVELRSLRYRYLAEILDDLDNLRYDQRGGAEPSSVADRSHLSGAPATSTGATRRCASPHAVRSTSGARSRTVSCARVGDAGCSP